MLKIIEDLMKQLGAKHGAYCNFKISSGYKDKKADYGNTVEYETYIDKEVSGANFCRHSTIEEAATRFKTFLDVDNIIAHNKELAQQKLERLLEEKESIDEEIETMQEIINFQKEAQ